MFDLNLWKQRKNNDEGSSNAILSLDPAAYFVREGKKNQTICQTIIEPYLTPPPKFLFIIGGTGLKNGPMSML